MLAGESGRTPNQPWRELKREREHTTGFNRRCTPHVCLFQNARHARHRANWRHSLDGRARRVAASLERTAAAWTPIDRWAWAVQLAGVWYRPRGGGVHCVPTRISSTGMFLAGHRRATSRKPSSSGSAGIVAMPGARTWRAPHCDTQEKIDGKNKLNRVSTERRWVVQPDGPVEVWG